MSRKFHALVDAIVTGVVVALEITVCAATKSAVTITSFVSIVQFVSFARLAYPVHVHALVPVINVGVYVVGAIAAAVIGSQNRIYCWRTTCVLRCAALIGIETNTHSTVGCWLKVEVEIITVHCSLRLRAILWPRFIISLHEGIFVLVPDTVALMFKELLHPLQIVLFLVVSEKLKMRILSVIHPLVYISLMINSLYPTATNVPWSQRRMTQTYR